MIDTLDHIITLPNVVSPQICQVLYQAVPDEKLYTQGVVEQTDKGMEVVVKQDVRHVLCGTDFTSPELINSIVQTTVEKVIEPRYRITVHYWEWPQLLVYPKEGGHYKPHVDSEYYYADKGWQKIADRDITLLLYLNDEYEGGNVIFPDYGITIRPKAGQLICFPSDRRFRHGVEPVTDGERRVLVAWLTVWGSKRVIDFPPKVKHVVRGQYSSVKQ